MKLILFGGTGMVGQRLAAEALSRGHDVTVVARDPSRLGLEHPRLTAVAGNVLDPASVASVVPGHDAVLSAIGPGGPSGAAQIIVDAAKSLVDGLSGGSVRRIGVVGGSGSLEVAPGVQLSDTPQFPDAWKDYARAHADALAAFRRSDLDWTVLSPAAMMQPGERTGRYRTASDQLIVDAEGQSRLSAEDLAVALLDEIERPQFVRQRFTAGY
ncbi:MAG: NAD(P)H-binding protein [Chloroflexi bacterium]|nr:NAD(P)H-binding protein [Chloroflexota bacterium]